ncbi:MAG: hypothetical protein RBG1_1C00001G0672 [candidate division Zixibacteria bacterium RBG-1]|nr:MAG: hypothetical protein RBG1_1C00001G0672 [candidate division Zixibacteria bacterium RBG-1]OGC85909.1 MAG: hypothetical protein A2V73_08135 [candidate division Zixibacteria bacterium RBG_19FT_COMBO_42_43]
MDIFAHGFWGGITFGRKKIFGLAMLFGVLPDVSAFGPFFVIRLIHRTLQFGKPNLAEIPSWVFTSYDISHSLITAAILYGVIRYFNKPLAYTFLAYPLHILCDIFTHSKSFFPTPFLFPVSSYKVDGISWADPTFMMVNYSAIFAAYAIFFIAKALKKKKSAN